ncbi:TfuA-like protein [Streptomyces sp. NPDC059224]|uniref:TfuA-like protein n=1 Tax=Streptomyces sp. NPDC059224 TaxID=3346775 RepID=UPI0036AA20FA
MHHVFVGPTLSRSEPVLSAPGVLVWPPAQHGDLFNPAIREGDTVVVIDGVYHQAPALRHKEILAAMGRGVRVIGAASIGALRAAELDSFGMVGVGDVYEAYARGEITGDDEVAVGQAPDGDRQALTWPVVSLRRVVRLAQAGGVLDEVRGDRLVGALRGVYYPQRTTAAVRAVCLQHGEQGFVRWLADHRARDPYFGDVKRADALAAVRAAREGTVPAGPRPALVTWESAYFRGWSNHFARTVVDGATLRTWDRVLYQQVFDREFSKRWTGLLDRRSRHPVAGEGLPLAERLHLAAGGTDVLEAHQVFQPALDLRDEATLVLLLAGETAVDREAVARYADALAVYRQTTSGAVTDDIARRVLMQVWGCGPTGLGPEASVRGLFGEAYAVAAVKRLVPGFLDEARQATGTKTEVTSGC